MNGQSDATAVSNPAVAYPPNLARIVKFFEGLDEEAKRENLILYAETAGRIGPKPGETFVLEDVRKDEECADTVGVFLKLNEGRASFRMTLGPHVQTLTKAMAAILCKGLEGATPEEVVEVPSDFVPKIVGGHLVRQRSQTTYYVLSRMKGICKVWLQRQRAAAQKAA